MAMKKKGYRAGGKVMKKKGYRAGGKVRRMAKGGAMGGKGRINLINLVKGGSTGGKKMTVAQLRAAAKKLGYKVSKIA